MNILTQSITITDSMFNFGNFLTKNAITFDPYEAKMIASRLKIADNSVQLAEWDKIKVSVMDFILRVKWNCCAKFRQSLLSTEGMVVAEATSCGFWGVGSCSESDFTHEAFKIPWP